MPVSSLPATQALPESVLLFSQLLPPACAAGVDALAAPSVPGSVWNAVFCAAASILACLRSLVLRAVCRHGLCTGFPVVPKHHTILVRVNCMFL